MVVIGGGNGQVSNISPNWVVTKAKVGEIIEQAKSALSGWSKLAKEY